MTSVVMGETRRLRFGFDRFRRLAAINRASGERSESGPEPSLHRGEGLFRRGQRATLDHPNVLQIAVPLRGNRTEAALRSAQILVEPVQCALPSLLCSRLVVTGSRVVVEAVIGALIDMTLVRHVGFR